MKLLAESLQVALPAEFKGESSLEPVNLIGLLGGGYIRPEPKNSDGSHVRLRVFRADDGSFYIQANQRERGLLIV